MPDKPTILGGTPVFDSRLDIISPTVPQLDDIADKVDEMLRSGHLTNNGPFLQEFEAKAGSYLNVPHCIAVTNGTVGLMLMFDALKLKGRVIVPSFTYLATVQAIRLSGLEPVFADIDPETYTLDPGQIETRFAADVVAVVPVNVFGNPPDYGEIQRIAAQYGLHVLYDSAQAFGTSYNGVKAGGFGDAEMFSLHAVKILGVGEGGLVTTRSAELAAWIRQARQFGLAADKVADFIAGNNKMSEFHAIIGLASLQMFERNAANRRILGTHMIEGLSDLPGLSFQQTTPHSKRVYQHFTIAVDADAFGLTRDQLRVALEAENISARAEWYPPVHRHRAYAEYTELYDPSLPVTNIIASTILVLPIHSHMSLKVADRIVEAIHRIQHHAYQIVRHVRV